MLGFFFGHEGSNIGNDTTKCISIVPVFTIPVIYKLDQNRKVYYLATAVYLENDWIQHRNVEENDLGLNVFVRHFETRKYCDFYQKELII